MKAIILDTVTGETGIIDTALLPTAQFTEGHASWDFRRSKAFPDLSPPLDPENLPQAERFLVIEAEFNHHGDTPAVLEDLNARYPKELLVKHGIPVRGHQPQVIPVEEHPEAEPVPMTPVTPEQAELLAPTPPDEPPALPPAKLPDEFNKALIGNTIAYDEAPRFVYSLTILATLEKKPHDLDPEDARRRVWEMVMATTLKHGKRAPMFIDDAAFMGTNDGPKIWTPGGR